MAMTVACLTSTQGHHKHTITPSVLSLWQEDLMFYWGVRQLLSGQLPNGHMKCGHMLCFHLITGQLSTGHYIVW